MSSNEGDAMDPVDELPEDLLSGLPRHADLRRQDIVESEIPWEASTK